MRYRVRKASRGVQISFGDAAAVGARSASRQRRSAHAFPSNFQGMEPLESRVLLSAMLVRDIGAPPDSSYPVFFLDADDGTAYFKVLHADIGSDGVVFRTDGTAAGTTLVASQVQANSGVAAGGTAYLGLAATSGSGMQNLDLRTPAGGF